MDSYICMVLPILKIDSLRKKKLVCLAECRETDRTCIDGCGNHAHVYALYASTVTGSGCSAMHARKPCQLAVNI